MTSGAGEVQSVVLVYAGLVEDVSPAVVLRQIDQGVVPGITSDRRIRRLVESPGYTAVLGRATLILEAVTPGRPNYVLLEVDDEDSAALLDDVTPLAERMGLRVHGGATVL